MKYNKDTSEKISDAAFGEFAEKGFNGARMQEIADKAGINKALLHYYYKSKDLLFEIILKKALKMLLPKILNAFNEDDDIFSSIEKFVALYIDTLIQHPQIPGFVIHEISNNPDRLIILFESLEINVQKIKQRLQKEMDNNVIIKMEPEQLMINILSLCIFPFIAKPLITKILLNGDKNEFQKLIIKRKQEVAMFINSAIKIREI